MASHDLDKKKQNHQMSHNHFFVSNGPFSHRRSHLTKHLQRITPCLITVHVTLKPLVLLVGRVDARLELQTQLDGLTRRCIASLILYHRGCL